MGDSIASRDPRARLADTEKLTVNFGFVDLGHIDLLVGDGFYSNRSDFIRTAVRNQLDRHAEFVAKSVARRAISTAASSRTGRDRRRSRRWSPPA